MSFLTALFGLRADPDGLDVRALDASLFAVDLEDVGPRSDAGVRVSTQTAMRLVSVWACVTLVADAVRSMPVDVYRRRSDGAREEIPNRPRWLRAPNQEQTWPQFCDLVMHALLVHGNAFIAIANRDSAGFPSELTFVHPDDISVRRVGGRKEFSWPAGSKTAQTLTPYTAMTPHGDILHILGHTSDGLVGLSPIASAAQSIGLGMAQDEFGARFFGQGAHASGVLEMPAGSVPTQPQLEALANAFDRKHAGARNAHKPVVLANGATFKPITVPNDQAQFIESRKFSVAEIARLYRVPPHLIGDVERSTSWGTGIEEQNIGFVTYTLAPWLTRLEDAFGQLIPSGQFLKFNVNSLLRGDVKSRMESYEIALRNGIYTRNEVRALEDLPPVPDSEGIPLIV